MLQRIADSLGAPVQSFYLSARSEEYPDETAELLRLWFKITDPNDLRWLLKEAERLARASQSEA